VSGMVTKPGHTCPWGRLSMGTCPGGGHLSTGDNIVRTPMVGRILRRSGKRSICSERMHGQPNIETWNTILFSLRLSA